VVARRERSLRTLGLPIRSAGLTNWRPRAPIQVTWAERLSDLRHAGISHRATLQTAVTCCFRSSIVISRSSSPTIVKKPVGILLGLPLISYLSFFTEERGTLRLGRGSRRISKTNGRLICAYQGDHRQRCRAMRASHPTSRCWCTTSQCPACHGVPGIREFSMLSPESGFFADVEQHNAPCAVELVILSN
jgi:hypothetical protein